MNDLVHFSFPLEDVISRLTDLKVTYDTMTLLYIVSIIVSNRFNKKAWYSNYCAVLLPQHQVSKNNGRTATFSLKAMHKYFAAQVIHVINEIRSILKDITNIFIIIIIFYLFKEMIKQWNIHKLSLLPLAYIFFFHPWRY